MSLLPKPFHELLNMKFIIPPYQRGYRWDSEQVETLLNDLQDFIKKYVKVNPNAKNQSVPYYCLQPIAVVKDFGHHQQLAVSSVKDTHASHWVTCVYGVEKTNLIISIKY